MILTLEVTGQQAARLGANRRMQFRAAGGTIGRVKSNDWVLADPYVSGYHARVQFNDGRFFLEDTSTNGVFVNSPDNRLQRGTLYPLKSGDRLFIDSYEIRVTLSAEEPDYAVSVFPETDPLKLLGNGGRNDSRRTPQLKAADLAGGSPLSQHYRPPEIFIEKARLPEPNAQRSVIPDDYIPDDYDPLAPTASTHGASTASQTVLAEPALSKPETAPEIPRNVEEILRVVVAGLMDLLRIRERTKDEFRMRMTTFKPADNNPLKFSANVEDALRNLLSQRNPAYLPPIEALNDAFRNVRDHQIAMLAGVRLAYEAMLAQFDPERLQAEFDRGIKKGGFPGVPSRLKYWDLYREQFHDRVKDADSCFRELFGDEFEKAYEEQLEKLRTLHRAGDE